MGLAFVARRQLNDGAQRDQASPLHTCRRLSEVCGASVEPEFEPPPSSPSRSVRGSGSGGESSHHFDGGRRARPAS
jgi:hypothetical protein